MFCNINALVIIISICPANIQFSIDTTIVYKVNFFLCAFRRTKGLHDALFSL